MARTPLECVIDVLQCHLGLFGDCGVQKACGDEGKGGHHSPPRNGSPDRVGLLRALFLRPAVWVFIRERGAGSCASMKDFENCTPLCHCFCFTGASACLCHFSPKLVAWYREKYEEDHPPKAKFKPTPMQKHF